MLKASCTRLSSRFLLVLLVLSLFVPCVSYAEQTVLTPGITVQTMYDDNVHFDGKGDWEFRVTPSLKLEVSQEDWKIGGGGRAAVFRYNNLSQYDRENYRFWIDGEKDLNERFQLNFDASYDYDHTFVDELTQSGTQTASALRRKYGFTPGAKWSLTEKDQLSFSIPISAIRYAGKDNPDSTATGGVLGWTHIMNNEVVSLLGQGTYNHYLYDRLDGDTNQDVFGLMGGMSYNPTELLNLRGLVGLGYYKSDVTFDSRSNEKTSRGYFSFDLSGTYSREKWKFTLGADRQVSPSTYGESSLRTRGRASGEYFFTERFSAYLEGAAYNTETGGLVSESKTRTYYVRPWLKYQWTEDASIRLEYKHTNTKNRISGKENHQNRIGLHFQYEYPSFL
ncbi:outer membrane beta-barrel protein [Pseudodesulfovibrio sp. zrk46]|uniref:outer membrane beta-barrel protein n=1 Tax=Pseudodesulfovibrio sp. zrk46 TaxID=2725288 RepID=UPI0014493692|nr:outer membrane beta-barrel protein [Pseudodesulfovibrio sp. zrk46]QJB55326.1 outer membrane beta-barrel protein [Pseudodesulfovibrio sp. zrk46]